MIVLKEHGIIGPLFSASLGFPGPISELMACRNEFFSIGQTAYWRARLGYIAGGSQRSCAHFHRDQS